MDSVRLWIDLSFFSLFSFFYPGNYGPRGLLPSRYRYRAGDGGRVGPEVGPRPGGVLQSTNRQTAGGPGIPVEVRAGYRRRVLRSRGSPVPASICVI